MTPGTRLGPYEILAPIGAGGMGEVYRARDTKLKRDVALKVLPEAFARDPERMARFQREAEVLASLNHPNIAAIYGVEDRALIMELVEGDSPKGPMPFDEAWHIASQIVAALEYAHERGIVHRDLKPANVKVTPDGVVKLLDFGLAKAFTVQPAGSADPENSPTLTIGATQVGVILGTAAYMSPEQARGKQVDKRADIWAFGVVLYELLTGERLFQGEDVSETLAQVLTKQPGWGQVPAQSRRLFQSCLEKDPKRRLRDIGDVWRQLEDTPQGASTARSKVPWAVALVTTVAALALGFAHLREAGPPERLLRYTLAAPEGGTVNSFAVSPDGHYVAIAAVVNRKRQLWLRALDALQATLLPGTEEALLPFWSPDSRYIGFFAQGKLKKIAANGGPSQSLCNAANGRGGTWNRDDVIVFSPDVTETAIQRVSAAGGVPAEVTRTRGIYRLPVFLPDGRRFLYLVSGTSPEKNGVYLSSLDGDENRRVLADESGVAFADGHLLFVRENTLMVQPFDARSAKTSGDAFPLAEGVSGAGALGRFAVFSVSESGLLLYASGAAVGNSQIVWYDRAGKVLGPVGAPGSVQPSISTDEKMIAFGRQPRPTDDIWLRDLTRGTDIRLTSAASRNESPFWSPKGDHIVFASNRSGHFDLYRRATSGSGQDELLLADANNKTPNQWSRDGRFIVYSQPNPKSKNDLWVLPVGEVAAANRKPISFLQTEFNEFEGQLSPDGRWMAYTSDETGPLEVYVRPFPASDGKWRISTAGGEQPRWRGDGKELFYVAADGKITAVPVKALPGPKPSFEPSTPVPLLEAHIAELNGGVYQYDVTADGTRFLVTTNTAGASVPPLTVVLNWTVGLKK